MSVSPTALKPATAVALTTPGEGVRDTVLVFFVCVVLFIERSFDDVDYLCGWKCADAGVQDAASVWRNRQSAPVSTGTERGSLQG